MHTVELLDEAIRVAEKLGYRVRQEWLDGGTGGACEIAGRKWIFVDLAVGPVDQLEQVLSALRQEPTALAFPMAAALRERLREDVSARKIA